MTRPRIYLAGPDVFFSDIEARAHAQKQCLAGLGLTALHPVDQPELSAEAIYRHNLALLEQADAVLANLNPFRGAEVDSGTAFEVGYAVALKKPVVGYVTLGETVCERVNRCHGPIRPAPGGGWHDRNGHGVEDFGLGLNLMLALPCTLVVGDFATAAQALARQLGLNQAPQD